MSDVVTKSREAALEIIKRHSMPMTDKGEFDQSRSKVPRISARFWPARGLASQEFQARFPDQGILICMAEMCTRGLIQFWQPWHMEKTHEPERIGDPINWTAVPNGDEEWPHALARFSHMLDLAAGYKLSRNVSMITTFNRHLHDFYSARGNEGELWGNRLDAALRLLNLIRSHDLLRDESEFKDADQLLCIALILRECELMHNGLGTRVGNWEFFITTSLLCAAVYLDGAFEVTRWRQDATVRLHQIMESEILEDGSLIEQVPMYHGVCVLALLDFLAVQKANSIALDQKAVNCANRMMGVLVRISDPSGLIPTIGDSDAFEVRYIAGYCDAVLGTDYCSDLERSHQGIASRTPVVDHLAGAGWTVVRWGNRDKSTGYLLFDLSGKPHDGRDGHSHADDLQFIFHNGRQPILVDAGRYTYTSLFLSEFSGLPWRVKHSQLFRRTYSLVRPRFRDMNERNWSSYFRHTLRHNTISCDGQNQFGYDGSSTRHAHVLSSRLITAGPMILCRALLNSEPDYRHERTFICQFPHFLLIVDHLSAPKPHDWVSSFHFGAGVQLTMTQQAVLVTGDGGAQHHIEFTDCSGAPVKINVIDDWISPEYNQRVSTKTAQVRLFGRAEATMLSLITLDPARNPSCKAGIEVRQDEGSDSAWAALRVATDEGEVAGYLRLKGSQLDIDGLATDAYYASIHKVGEKATEIGYLDGNFIEIYGKRHVNASGRELHTLVG